MNPHIEPDQLLATIDGDLRGAPRAVLTTMTPDLARDLLARYSEAKRPLSDDYVQRLIYRIHHPDPEGWIFEEVSVSPEGVTIAGQHLLHAIVATGIAVPTITVLLNRSSDLT